MRIEVPFPPLPKGPHTMEQAQAICEARERQLKAAGLVRAPNGEWVTPEDLAALAAQQEAQTSKGDE